MKMSSVGVPYTLLISMIGNSGHTKLPHLRPFTTVEATYTKLLVLTAMWGLDGEECSSLAVAVCVIFS